MKNYDFRNVSTAALTAALCRYRHYKDNNGYLEAVRIAYLLRCGEDEARETSVTVQRINKEGTNAKQRKH